MDARRSGVLFKGLHPMDSDLLATARELQPKNGDCIGEDVALANKSVLNIRRHDVPLQSIYQDLLE